MALFKYDSENLVYKKTNKILKYRVIVAVLFISVFFLSFIAAKKPEKEYIKTEITIKEESYKKELSFLKYDNVMALYQKSINDINDVNNEINIYKTTINIMNQLKENGLEKEYNDFRFDMRTELINSKSIEYKLFDDIDKKEIPYTNENALKLINKYIKSGGVRLNEKLYNRSSIHSLNELKAMVSEEIKSKNDISLNINKLESYANVNNSEDNFFNEYLPKFKKVLPELDDNKLDTIMLNAILRLNKSKKILLMK